MQQNLYSNFVGNEKLIIFVLLSTILIALSYFTVIGSKRFQLNRLLTSRTVVSSSMNFSAEKQSKWKKDQLVVIPAVWKEIDWTNRSSWPSWLRQGLDPSNISSSLQSYQVHLYQRIDPNSRPPYDWPYCKNIHEETGVYLKFIYEYYYDLPDKMLFLHGNPTVHSSHPIEKALCIRDDIHYTSINFYWINERPWSFWLRDSKDNISFMYKCASKLLTLFGFNGNVQLNIESKTPKDDNTITTLCCAQFYVTKQRIHHYTYEQWSAVYRASFEPDCTTEGNREKLGEKRINYLGGSFEHLWHVIFGLYAINMPVPIPGTNTDVCHTFRSSCKGSPCTK
ncbi:hypothetical protein I4U23_011342 [Adineta vaga]|nr:hypothetical protein I4U23_011342 [Adineta vaga]